MGSKVVQPGHITLIEQVNDLWHIPGALKKDFKGCQAIQGTISEPYENLSAHKKTVMLGLKVTITGFTRRKEIAESIRRCFVLSPHIRVLMGATYKNAVLGGRVIEYQVEIRILKDMMSQLACTTSVQDLHRLVGRDLWVIFKDYLRGNLKYIIKNRLGGGRSRMAAETDGAKFKQLREVVAYLCFKSNLEEQHIQSQLIKKLTKKKVTYVWEFILPNTKVKYAMAVYRPEITKIFGGYFQLVHGQGKSTNAYMYFTQAEIEGQLHNMPMAALRRMLGPHLLDDVLKLVDFNADKED